MSVSEVIVEKLKKENRTKQWLASKINLSYSTLHQKLSNNTFTAEELVSLCVLFKLDIHSFVERPKEGKVEIMDIPIFARPDVYIESMDDYLRNGIGIESEHENGSLLYLPYGIQNYLAEHFDVIRVMFDSYREAIETKKEEYENENNQLEPQLLEEKLHQLNTLATILENAIQTIKESI